MIFAIPRTSGWIAQWLEMVDDEEQRIARPRQIYQGDRELEYTPMDQRSEGEPLQEPSAPLSPENSGPRRD